MKKNHHPWHAKDTRLKAMQTMQEKRAAGIEYHQEFLLKAPSVKEQAAMRNVRYRDQEGI